MTARIARTTRPTKSAKTVKSAQTKNWIHLDPKEKGNDVVVHAEDGDTFVISVADAVRACKSLDNVDRFRKQVNILLNWLSAWIEGNKNDIKKCYFTFRDAGFLFLVVRKTKPFNRELEDSLTSLDIKVAQSSDFDLLKMSVLALPDSTKECVDSFISPTMSFVYNAQ